jgi:hypothetical protein
MFARRTVISLKTEKLFVQKGKKRNQERKDINLY